MKTATAHSRARHSPDLTVAKIDIVRVTSFTNIFTATSAPASARRINAVGPVSSPNSFSNKASSERFSVELVACLSLFAFRRACRGCRCRTSGVCGRRDVCARRNCRTRKCRSAFFYKRDESPRFCIRKVDAQWTHERPNLSRKFLLAGLPRPAHDVNGEDPALMPRKEIINKIADDRVRFVAELGHHATDQGATAAMPFEIDRAMKIAPTVDFRPAVRTPRLLGPGFDEAELFFQLRIARDLTAQRSASGRDHLDDRLHLLVRFNRVVTFAIFL